MAGFGFSPADIVDGSKFLYQAYKAAKNAPERYATARKYADGISLLLDEIPAGSDQHEPISKGLALHLDLANKAYETLDGYLSHFHSHLAQNTRSRMTADNIAARSRWMVDQLDKKLDKLQDAVQSALGHCQVAMISQLR